MPKRTLPLLSMRRDMGADSRQLRVESQGTLPEESYAVTTDGEIEGRDRGAAEDVAGAGRRLEVGTCLFAGVLRRPRRSRAGDDGERHVLVGQCSQRRRLP